MSTAVRAPRRWPLALLAMPAFVAVWAGWVELGEMTGFGVVKLLPGIVDHLVINTAVTLPIGVEAYSVFAMSAWLTTTRAVSAGTRRFAKWSALGSLALGAGGQVAYHLMRAAGYTVAPWWITAVVACIPVGMVGMAAGLMHMLRRDAAGALAGTTTAPATAPATAPQPVEQPVGDRLDDRSATAPTTAPGDRSATAPQPVEQPVGDRLDDRSATAPTTAPGDRSATAPTTASGDRSETTGQPVGQSAERPVGNRSRDRSRNRPRRRAASTRERARLILTERPDITGSQLGRELGVSASRGRALLREIRREATAAEVIPMRAAQ